MWMWFAVSLTQWTIYPKSQGSDAGCSFFSPSSSIKDPSSSSSSSSSSNVTLLPQRPYGLLGTRSPGRPPRLFHTAPGLWKDRFHWVVSVMLYVDRNHWSGLLGTESPGRSPRLTFTQLLSSAKKIVLLHIFVYDLWFGQVTRGALRRRPKNNLSSVKRAQGAVRLPAVTPKLRAPACNMYPWPCLQPQLCTRLSLATNCRSSNSVSTEINQQGIF